MHPYPFTTLPQGFTGSIRGYYWFLRGDHTQLVASHLRDTLNRIPHLRSFILRIHRNSCSSHQKLTPVLQQLDHSVGLLDEPGLCIDGHAFHSLEW